MGVNRLCSGKTAVGLARKGAPQYGFLTYQDQLRRHPTDEGLQFVPEVVSTEVQWTDW